MCHPCCFAQAVKDRESVCVTFVIAPHYERVRSMAEFHRLTVSMSKESARAQEAQDQVAALQWVQENARAFLCAPGVALEDIVRAVNEVGATPSDLVSILEALKAAAYPGTGRSVADELTQLIAVIGENMSIRRTAMHAADPGVVGSYVHGQTAPGLGKIGVLVALDSSGDKEKLAALGKQLAMHVAASAPQAIDKDGVDPATLARRLQGAPLAVLKRILAFALARPILSSSRPLAVTGPASA